MSLIYAKTAQGQHEIETRERRLPPRLRSALILVDGKRNEDELAKLIQNADETLRALLDLEMIAVVAGRAAKEVRTAEPEAPAAAAPAFSAEEFVTMRRDAVRALNDLLGPEAESLALRLERSADPEQLRAALERAVTYIANARGGGAAATFAARFLKVG